MKYDKEVLTINDILTALDNFDNKEEIINAIKQSLYDIETDWHNEEYLRHQLQSYKAKEDKLREYISKNVFLGHELIYKEDTKNGFIAEFKSHLFKIIPTNKDFITNILAILNEGDK